VSGRRRESGYAAAWIGLGIAVSLLLVPGVVWQDWLANVLPAGGYGRTPAGLFSPAVSWNQSLNGYIARAFSEGSAPLTYAVAGLVAAISGVAVWQGSRIHADSLDRTMMVALPAMFLLAPLSWEHHLVYLLPACLMVITARVVFPLARTTLFYLIGIGASVLIALDGLSRIKFYGVAVLWVLCVIIGASRDIQLVNEDPH
jgi:alpha-1,2-mannosyltransferase